MAKEDWWSLVSWLCGAYVFLGFLVFAIALDTHNAIWIGLSIVAWICSIFLLRYANKQW